MAAVSQLSLQLRHTTWFSARQLPAKTGRQASRASGAMPRAAVVQARWQAPQKVQPACRVSSVG